MSLFPFASKPFSDMWIWRFFLSWTTYNLLTSSRYAEWILVNWQPMVPKLNVCCCKIWCHLWLRLDFISFQYCVKYNSLAKKKTSHKVALEIYLSLIYICGLCTSCILVRSWKTNIKTYSSTSNKLLLIGATSSKYSELVRFTITIPKQTLTTS